MLIRSRFWKKVAQHDRIIEDVLYMCFVDIEKAFDRVPRKVMEWAMKKKNLPEVIVRVVINLYHRAKMKVRVGSEYLKNFWYKLVYIKDLCCCHCFLQLQ